MKTIKDKTDDNLIETSSESDKVIKRGKRLLVVMLAIILLASCSCIAYVIMSLTGVTGESKNAKKLATTDAVFSITGKTGGFIFKDKYYAKGKTVSLGGISAGTKAGSNVFFFAADGQTTFNIKGEFGKKLVLSSGKSMIFYVESYNAAGSVMESKKKKVTSNSHTINMVSKKGIHHVKISLVKDKNTIYTLIIKVGNLPTIEHKSLSGASRNSSGEFLVKNIGEVKLRFTITNESEHPLYYRWFTYKDYTMSASNINSTNKKCVLLNKKATADYPLNVNRKRAARIRIYSSYENCISDDNSKYPTPTAANTSRKVMKEHAVKYRPKNTYTNELGFEVPRNYNRAYIGEKIGSQGKSQCKDYAYKYAYYIKYGKFATSISPKCTTYSSVADLLKIIRTNIDNSSATMVFFHNDYGEYKQHWGVAVGYKPNDRNEVTSLSQILFLDPSSDLGYNKFGKNVLWQGTIRNEKGGYTRNTMKALKNNRYCYVA